MTFPHTLIRASAGTGKTFQLSNRYVGLAAAGEPLEGILATTFTRKAAGEILERVLTRLAKAAADAAEAGQLAEYAQSPRLDSACCLNLLRGMVRQLHQVRTGTLDSFFIQIARNFALELGLPPGWQIVDEVYDAQLRDEAIRAVLAAEATSEVVSLMNLLTKGEAARSVSEQISGLVAGLYSLYAEAPAEAWHSLPRPKLLSTAEVAEARAALAEVALPENKRFVAARDGDLENTRLELWEEFLGKGLAAKILAGETTYCRAAISAEVAAAYQPLLDHARAVLVGRIVNQTEATFRLLKRFDQEYQRLKIARRALRFEDVTRTLGTSASGGTLRVPDRHTECAAYIAERLDDVVYRLDAHVAHLLLDEFQDTAPLQWQVLRPFARRVTEAARRGSFFCVGDVKQAIYGWRGGVAEIFDALAEELPGLSCRGLDESYRSSPVVIGAVNRVFAGLASNAVLQRCAPAAAAAWAARFAEHTTAKTALPGHCRMITAPAAEAAGDQWAVTLVCAAEEIARLHAECPDATIGVLVRRNKAVARLIYELRQRKIEASEEGGVPLTDSAAVQLVLSLLVLADHPGDTVARFHVATSPLGERVGLSDYADDSAAARLAADIRRRLMDDGYGPTVYGWARLLDCDCDGRDRARLDQLVGLAYAYEADATSRPGDFVHLVHERKVEDPTAARVRVMTVHQAKGLEFDIVVLPELDARLTGQTPQVVVGRPKPTAPVRHICRYVSKGLRPLLPPEFQKMFEDSERLVIEESLCVLYVAMTRAVHALHMIVAPSREKEKMVPATFAGVLRAALTDGNRIEPDTVLYEQGNAGWFAADNGSPLPLGEGLGVRGTSPAPAESAAPVVVRLAPPGPRAVRGLERRSPSQLEGGARVRLAHQLRLDTTALDRGSLLHAWFALIEWLDDGEPTDEALRAVAAKPDFRGLDVHCLMAEFRALLQMPAIREVLSNVAGTNVAGTLRVPSGADGTRSVPATRVWRERKFAIRDGDTILNGAIDRLVVSYDGDRPVAAEVLDFKTDVLPPEDAAALAARVAVYRPQLDAYRRAVAAMFGLDDGRVSARLAFVEPGAIVTV